MSSPLTEGIPRSQPHMHHTWFYVTYFAGFVKQLFNSNFLCLGKNQATGLTELLLMHSFTFNLRKILTR